ncbi:putative F-box protein At4g21240 [Neltuma alba]|uniref:putative F-box protein At4g21240 n=1 Tax=Neltuma alba TaxID=207710 RepID=UPI0010A44CF0|nr:putative F-box protein At4g21240 [Prosopis alba]
MDSLDSLPDDVLFHHILPPLPTVSLVRCRYFCKSWPSIVRDPHFLALRQSFYPTSGHLLFVCPASAVATSELQVFSAPISPGQADPPLATHIATIPNLNASMVDVQCVNGLLCLHPKNSSNSKAFAHIFNPTTRQIITLPDDSSVRDKFRASTHFGYDPIRDEFKVLRLLKYNDSHEFKIFTIGDATNSWKLVNNATATHIRPTNWFLEDKRGVCVNGAIHWKYSSYILAFDLRSEQFRQIDIPDGYKYKEHCRPHLKFPDLVELSGCLTLVGYDDRGLNLTILEDYETREWTQKRIILPDGANERIHFPLCSVPKTGEILLMPYFLGRLVRVIYHDKDKTSSRRAVVMKMLEPLWPDQKSGYINIFFYQENFRLLD